MFKTTPVSTSSEFGRIGVGLDLPDYARGHVGLLYRARVGGVVRMCHLAGHRALCAEDENVDFPDYVWASAQMPQPQQELLADWCPTLAEYETSYIYGPHYLPGVLSLEQTEPTFPQAWAGLTCATFVLEVFGACGFPLIDLTSWRRRVPEDEIWLESILRMMRRQCVDEGFIAAIRDHQLAGRYRPSEVATAVALCRDASLTFDPLTGVAALIEASLLMPQTAVVQPQAAFWSLRSKHHFCLTQLDTCPRLL